MPGWFKKAWYGLASLLSFSSSILIIAALALPRWLSGKILCQTGVDLVNATDPELVKFVGDIYYGLFRGCKVRQCGLGGRQSQFTSEYTAATRAASEHSFVNSCMGCVPGHKSCFRTLVCKYLYGVCARALHHRVKLCDPMDCGPPTRLLCPWDFPGKNTGVGLSLNAELKSCFSLRHEDKIHSKPRTYSCSASRKDLFLKYIFVVYFYE